MLGSSLSCRAQARVVPCQGTNDAVLFTALLAKDSTIRAERPLFCMRSVYRATVCILLPPSGAHSKTHSHPPNHSPPLLLPSMLSSPSLCAPRTLAPDPGPRAQARINTCLIRLIGPPTVFLPTHRHTRLVQASELTALSLPPSQSLPGLAPPPQGRLHRRSCDCQRTVDGFAAE
jgi:hypothetical protein